MIVTSFKGKNKENVQYSVKKKMSIPFVFYRGMATKNWNLVFCHEVLIFKQAFFLCDKCFKTTLTLCKNDFIYHVKI